MAYNILYITVRSDIGGGPKYLLDLMAKGDKASQYIAAPDGEYWDNYVGCSRKQLQIPFRKFSFISFLRIFIFLRNNNIWTIHSHGYGAGIYSRILGLFAIEVIHTYHGLHYPKNSKEKIKAFIDKTLSYLTNKTIHVAMHEMEKAIQFGHRPEKTQLTHTTIDKTKIAHVISTKNRECLRNSFNMNNNMFVIGALTRLDPIKNIKELIDRFHEFSKDRKRPALFIAGDGEQRKALEEYASQSEMSDHIFFIGAINNPIEFLYSIDLFVSLSFSEGMPLAPLEALECQKPCIFSNIPAHNELLKLYPKLIKIVDIQKERNHA